MEYESINWLVFGLVLAIIFILASGLAYLTRLVHEHKLQGQLYWLVVAGVAIVVGLMGLVIGFRNAGLLLAGFAVSAIPMGFEYFGRVASENKEARKVREESIQ